MAYLVPIHYFDGHQLTFTVAAPLNSNNHREQMVGTEGLNLNFSYLKWIGTNVYELTKVCSEGDIERDRSGCFVTCVD